MTSPYYHAESSARKFGGVPEDYLEIHQWFDASKRSFADFRHRAMRHHSEGIYESIKVFGITITNSNGKKVPVSYVGEQHIMEDCGGKVPNISDWLENIQPKRWMSYGTIIGESKDASRAGGEVTDDTEEGSGRIKRFTVTGSLE